MSAYEDWLEARSAVREYFDATRKPKTTNTAPVPCKSPWQGTKPPGCTRGKKGEGVAKAAATKLKRKESGLNASAPTKQKASSKMKFTIPEKLQAEDLVKMSNARFQFERNKHEKQRSAIKNELTKVAEPVTNKWGETTYFYAGKTPADERKYKKAKNALSVSGLNEWEFTKAEGDRNESVNPQEVAKKALDRRKKQTQRTATQEQKKKERQSYAQARQVVQKNVNSLPAVERALMGVSDPIVATNLRRRLEENLSNGSIKQKDFDKAFNAVSTSGPHKEAIKKALKKAGVKIVEPPKPEDLEKVAPYEELRKLTTKDRQQKIHEAAKKLGVSEDEAMEMWRGLRDIKAVERRKALHDKISDR